MLQTFDNAAAADSGAQKTGRADWMALLARAPLPMLEGALSAIEPACRTEWLRRPETGLYMVQGRVGAIGERFNVGEITVTRCTLRVLGEAGSDATVGVAYVLGRSHRKAQLAALADALLQKPVHGFSAGSGLLDAIRGHLAQAAAGRQARAQSTRVDFFTVAREAAGPDGEEQE
jgi:alpha-D-ribose 1-methylphosphonate 5-triphosphate synthase subunit PhnG